jgi:hypothetical protein
VGDNGKTNGSQDKICINYSQYLEYLAMACSQLPGMTVQEMYEKNYDNSGNF